MNREQDLGSVARAIIDANLYMVVGTADPDGRPWVTPVYFAHEAYREFFWVSSPEAAHSRNLGTRPEVGIVVFDSQVPISTGQAVYMEGAAEEVLPGPDQDGVLAIFSRRTLEHGGREWTSTDVQGDARLRLYRVTASEHFVLGERDERVPVTP